MKRRWLKVLGAILLIVIILLCWGHWSNHKIRTEVEQTRRELKEAGFKTDLGEFDLKLPPDVWHRADTVIATGGGFVRAARFADMLEPMKPIGSNSALTLWRQESFNTWQGSKNWAAMDDEFKEQRRQLDAVCAALISGPLRFEPGGSNGNFLLPYAARVKSCSYSLRGRTLYALHGRNIDEAYTNLFTLSRLVTAWNPEPIEICHLVRYAIVSVAQSATWEAMQSDGWSDEKLAALQHEWESTDFFKGLPETAALNRACTVAMCRAGRQETFIADYGGGGEFLKYMWASVRNSPAQAGREILVMFRAYRDRSRYRNHGSYVDEKDLLLFYRDREEELKRAVVCSTWAEMQLLPGATNVILFQSTNASRFTSMMNNRQMMSAVSFSHQGGGGRTLLGRAAEAEARCRLIVTAIALKRFQLAHGDYPQTLAELVPAFLPKVPVDFMDGNELRYHKNDDGRFLLYSVGLDGVDDGGLMVRQRQRSERGWPGQVPGNYPMSDENLAFNHPPQGVDIVWPLPATQTEVEAYEEQVLHAELLAMRDIAQEARDFAWQFMNSPKTLTHPYPMFVLPTDGELGELDQEEAARAFIRRYGLPPGSENGP